MQPRITIVIPISRDAILDKLFANLEFLECDKDKTNLFVIVDGDFNLYLKVRGKVEASKFNQKLTIHYKAKTKPQKYSVEMRRKRIASLHNEAKKYIWDSDFIMGLEDDTIFKPSTLKKLLTVFSNHPYAGIVEGLQLGRWGVPYIGAWQFDDIYDPKAISSIAYIENEVIEIDAGGFYCFLTRANNYLDHTFENLEIASLGPDANYGIQLRQAGHKNFIDTSIICGHFDERSGETLTPLTTKPKVITIKKINNKWRHNA